MAARLLVLNAGSSSLKFRTYIQNDSGELRPETRGQLDGFGARPRFRVTDGDGRPLADEARSGIADAGEALDVLQDWLAASLPALPLAGVGHRVAHGGERHTAPVLVTPAVIASLRAEVPLAPLHQPHNLAPIERIAAAMPSVPQVACFDTAFHHSLPELARLIPLPERVRAAGVRRYGFHGLSYEYIASVLPEVRPEIADGRIIVAHLGNGASLCAMRGRRSIETTMSFTPLDGLCMGTRPGSLDPGVLLHLLKAMGLSVDELERMLHRESGLAGISGGHSDMRELLADDAPASQLAVGYFVYQATRQIGALAAVLGGLDGLVFTAGIGEHATEIRSRIGAACEWLGLELDAEANARHATCISTPASRVTALVIPTDEELMIARHTRAVLDRSPAARSGSA